MQELLPGTTVEADLSRQDADGAVLSPLFLTGGLMLSQVAQLTGLEPHVIQNWVRRGFVSPPVRKKYSRRQFCRIAIINMLKDSLRLERICTLLSYLNGRLDDERDDLIDDAQLYSFIVRALGQVDPSSAGGPELSDFCACALSDYCEPAPGARARVEAVLQVILTAYLASRLKQKADQMIMKLEALEH